jgi:ribosomal protein L16 Arg81 hydroxylase
LKKTLILALLFSVVVTSDYFGQAIQQKSAQQSEQTELAPEKIAELQRKITQIEAHIQAIETKKAYVLSDPAELEKATTSGWFDSMESIKQELLSRKQTLLNALNGFDNE